MTVRPNMRNDAPHLGGVNSSKRDSRIFRILRYPLRRLRRAVTRGRMAECRCCRGAAMPRALV